MTPSICAIILAAGTSSRMGKPKQLLLLNERPLLEHVIQRVLAAPFSDVVAVIGNEAEQIQKEISVEDKRFQWLVNENYLSGQSSSLQAGISHVGQQHDGIMIFLGDLPFISDATIQRIMNAGMISLKDYKDSFIIQPSYHGETGHPVFFGSLNRDLIMQIKGDTGAKAIMKNISYRKLLEVEDEGILFDIDTPEIYEKAKKLWGVKRSG